MPQRRVILVTSVALFAVACGEEADEAPMLTSAGIAATDEGDETTAEPAIDVTMVVESEARCRPLLPLGIDNDLRGTLEIAVDGELVGPWFGGVTLDGTRAIQFGDDIAYAFAACRASDDPADAGLFEIAYVDGERRLDEHPDFELELRAVGLDFGFAGDTVIIGDGLTGSLEAIDTHAGHEVSIRWDVTKD